MAGRYGNVVTGPYDEATVAAQACGPGSVWNGTRCVSQGVPAQSAEKAASEIRRKRAEQRERAVRAPAGPLVDGWAVAGAPAPPPLSAREKALQSQQRAEDWAAGQSQALADIADVKQNTLWSHTPGYETPEGIDVEALAAQGPSFTDQSLWGLDDSTMQAIQDALDARPFEDAGEVSPYNEDSEFRGQYSPEFDAADATSGLTDPAADMGAGETDEELLARFLDGLGGEDPAAPAGATMDKYGGGDDAAYRAWQDETGIYERDADGNLIDHGGWSAWQLWDSAKRMGVTDPWMSGQGDMGAGGGDAGDEGAGDEGGGETPAFDATPDGVPTFVAAQVDELNVINQRLKSIKDAHKKLLDSGIEEIDGIEEALTEAESKIYESQYGAVDPLTGEVLTPGEMDRLLSTFETRRTTSKKNRTADRAEILAIMTDEGVPAGLAQSELDMIQAIHGDSIDTQFDYIESLWRIGKLSHDERTSMIGNMIGSYKLQLRDTVVEMLMAEEVGTADDVAAAQQDALRADTIAGLFPDMTEDQVYGLMRSGMADLLQLPVDKEIGMISTGEWAGYTQGEKSNVLLSAGYTQNADGTFTAPAADAADDDKVLSKLMPDGTTWSGTADEYYDEHGEYIFAAGDEEITQDLPDGTSFTGTVADYVARSGVYPFAAAAEQDDPNTFTVSVDRINELDPTGAWLRGSGLQVVGARPDSPQRAGASGFVTMNWDDWIFTEDPYEAVKDPEEEDRKYNSTVNGEDWYGTPQEYTAVTGKYMFAPDDPAPVPVPSSIMEADFPGLLVARPTLMVVDGEYWLTPEDINVYGQIAELREGSEMDFGEMLRNGAYPGYPVPINLREQVQAMAVQLQTGDEGFETIPLDQLYITAVLMEAPVNEDYARLAAKYLGVDVDVNDPTGAKSGHINHRTGEFVRIGDLRTYR